MNWDAIGALGEIFGALAVVATLVYLSRQIKHQSVATVGETTNAWLADYNALIVDLMRNPELTDLFRRGLDDFEVLTGDEQMRLHVYLIAHLLNAQNVYMQLDDEIIHRQIAENVLEHNAALLATKGGNHWWSTCRPILRKGFVEHLDNRIANSLPVTDVWPWFSKTIGDQKSKSPSNKSLESGA